MKKVRCVELFWGLSVRRLNNGEQNAEDYTEMHGPLGAHFLVFVPFKGNQAAAC